MRHQIKTMAFVGGISQECGLETYLIRPMSINTESFIEFLEKLRDDNDENPLVIFMDNLQVHKTRAVT